MFRLNSLLKPQNQLFRWSSSLPTNAQHSAVAKVTRLPSGLRVASVENSGEDCAVGVYINSGSSNEHHEQSGISNMLQHLAWKGSASRQKRQLEKEVENVGGKLSSYTSREQTAYIGQSLKKDAHLMVNVLADVVQTTNWSAEQIEMARVSALKEQKCLEEDLEFVMYDHVHSAAFQSSNLGNSVVGEARSVKNLSKSDLEKFVKDNYTTSRTVLVGSGVKHEEFVKQVESAFSLPNTPYNPSKFVDFVGSEIRIKDETMHDLHSIYAFQGVGWNDPNYWTFLIIQALIGNFNRHIGGAQHLSSRLAETIGLEKLGDSFHCFYRAYSNTGILGVYGSAVPEKADDFCYEIFNEFQKLSSFISPEELTLAKNQVKVALIKRLQGNYGLIEDIGRSVLNSSRHLSLPELITRINEIEVSDVHSTIDTYFYDVCPAIVIYGPDEILPDYGTIRNWTYWNRW